MDPSYMKAGPWSLASVPGSDGRILPQRMQCILPMDLFVANLQGRTFS